MCLLSPYCLPYYFPNTSIAASRACSLVLPFHPVRRLNASAVSFVLLRCGATASYGIEFSLQKSSHILQSRITKPLPCHLPISRRRLGMVGIHFLCRASSNTTLIHSLDLQKSSTDNIAFVIVVVSTESKFLDSVSHTANPVLTPVSIPIYFMWIFYKIRTAPQKRTECHRENRHGGRRPDICTVYILTILMFIYFFAIFIKFFLAFFQPFRELRRYRPAHFIVDEYAFHFS